jgi:hypothetical protein
VYRTDPDLSDLRVGEPSRVGIPPTDLYVNDACLFDPPEDASGWTPGWHMFVGVARCGIPPVIDLEPRGFMFEPYGPDPVQPPPGSPARPAPAPTTRCWPSGDQPPVSTLPGSVAPGRTEIHPLWTARKIPPRSQPFGKRETLSNANHV